MSLIGKIARVAVAILATAFWTIGLFCALVSAMTAHGILLVLGHVVMALVLAHMLGRCIQWLVVAFHFGVEEATYGSHGRWL